MKTVLVLGDGGVGKSTMIDLLTIGGFEKRYIADEHPSITNFEFGNNQLKVTIAPGQYMFSPLPDMNMVYDRIVIVFDVTSKSSFINTDHWWKKAQQCCKFSDTGERESQMILCGNKIDRPQHDVKIGIDKMQAKLAEGAKYDKAYQMSAKTGHNLIHMLYD